MFIEIISCSIHISLADVCCCLKSKSDKKNDFRNFAKFKKDFLGYIVFIIQLHGDVDGEMIMSILVE
jgi:hypothetical protein